MVNNLTVWTVVKADNGKQINLQMPTLATAPTSWRTNDHSGLANTNSTSEIIEYGQLINNAYKYVDQLPIENKHELVRVIRKYNSLLDHQPIYDLINGKDTGYNAYDCYRNTLAIEQAIKQNEEWKNRTGEENKYTVPSKIQLSPKRETYKQKLEALCKLLYADPVVAAQLKEQEELMKKPFVYNMQQHPVIKPEDFAGLHGTDKSVAYTKVLKALNESKPAVAEVPKEYLDIPDHKETPAERKERIKSNVAYCAKRPYLNPDDADDIKRLTKIKNKVLAIIKADLANGKKVK